MRVVSFSITPKRMHTFLLGMFVAVKPPALLLTAIVVLLIMLRAADPAYQLRQDQHPLSLYSLVGFPFFPINIFRRVVMLLQTPHHLLPIMHAAMHLHSSHVR